MGNFIDFQHGDTVVVVDHDPDPDYREKEIPIGTVGFFLRRQGECHNPTTGDTEPYGEVLFYCDPKNHPWCSDQDDKTLASMFYSTLALVDEGKYDIGPLDEFFEEGK